MECIKTKICTRFINIVYTNCITIEERLSQKTSTVFPCELTDPFLKIGLAPIIMRA